MRSVASFAPWMVARLGRKCFIKTRTLAELISLLIHTIQTSFLRLYGRPGAHRGVSRVEGRGAVFIALTTEAPRGRGLKSMGCPKNRMGVSGSQSQPTLIECMR